MNHRTLTMTNLLNLTHTTPSPSLAIDVTGRQPSDLLPQTLKLVLELPPSSGSGARGRQLVAAQLARSARTKTALNDPELLIPLRFSNPSNVALQITLV
jgi:hypothetical protein